MKREIHIMSITVRFRRIRTVRAIHQHDRADEGHDAEYSRTHRDEHVRLAEKLANLLAISDEGSLRESERITFELWPCQLIFMGNVFELVNETGSQTRIVQECQVILASQRKR